MVIENLLTWSKTRPRPGSASVTGEVEVERLACSVGGAGLVRSAIWKVSDVCIDSVLRKSALNSK